MSMKKWPGIYFYWNCRPKEIKYYCGSHLQASINGSYRNYSNRLLEGILKEQKSIFLLGDFKKSKCPAYNNEVFRLTENIRINTKK